MQAHAANVLYSMIKGWHTSYMLPSQQLMSNSMLPVTSVPQAVTWHKEEFLTLSKPLHGYTGARQHANQQERAICDQAHMQPN
jgi:hypothetical protein